MKAVIIVPWRPGVAEREDSWRFTRRWWERFGYPIFEVEHAGPEPFNRAWCLNEGARRAWPWDVALMIDADVLEDRDEQVTQAVITAWETGSFTVGHTAGRDLDEKGTKWVLDRQAFDWHKRVSEVREVCDSRVNAIRVDLFERLGGFDERFRGWGHEDVAFTAAAQLAGGPIQRVAGSSWHLYHAPMLPQSKPTAEWQAGRTLAQRYLAAVDQGWDAVQEILDERADGERFRPPWPDVLPAHEGAATDLVVLTSGRREYLQATLASADERLHGLIVNRLMFDDSGDPAFAAWLDERYGDRFKIHHNERNLGYSVAMSVARETVAAAGGSPLVFWLEDDFIFNRDVDLGEMAQLLENERLAQVALLRGPYYEREIAAGSIPDEHPESYVRAVFRGIRYLRHERFYTSNPNLARRELYEIPWPEGRHTESRFGKQLVAQGMQYAFLGWGESWIEHIGAVRGGHGY